MPKRKLTRQQIDHANELQAVGEAPGVIAGILRVSRATVYRVAATQEIGVSAGILN
jgi:hypothetical protein